MRISSLPLLAATWFAAFLLASCTPASPVSVATLQPTITPQPVATTQPTPLPPSQDAGLYADYSLALDPATNVWVVHNSAGELAASWNSQVMDWEYDFETIARDERISIFDANSFPDRFNNIARNWLTATDEEWLLYQEFVEASRAEFFEQEGITDAVAAMTGINEDLRSLWGIGYWIQRNREQAITEQLACLVTPQEFSSILEENSFARWSTRIIENENGVKIIQGHGINAAIGGGNEYNSETVGPILGRNDFRVGSIKADSASGNMLCVAQPFPDDPARLIPIINMRAPQDGKDPAFGDLISETGQQYFLYAMLFVLEENAAMPAGTMAFVSRTGEPIHPASLNMEIEIGLPEFRHDGDPRQGLFDAIGGGATTISFIGKTRNDITLWSIIDPQTGLQVAIGMSRGDAAIDVDGWPYAWPWQQ